MQVLGGHVTNLSPVLPECGWALDREVLLEQGVPWLVLHCCGGSSIPISIVKFWEVLLWETCLAFCNLPYPKHI